MSKLAIEHLPALDLPHDDAPRTSNATPSTIPASPARPANLKRSLFHVASGLFAIALIRFLPSRAWLIGVAGAFFVFAWTAELSRKRSPAVNAVLMKVFSPIAHASEHTQVNSSTWYITALLLLATFSPLNAAELGIVVLAFADPAAGTIGRRFGKTKIRKNRSLEGALAFVVVGTIMAAAWAIGVQGMAMPRALIIAAAAALIGSVAEVFLTKLDDNFAIPVTATVAAAAALMLV